MSFLNTINELAVGLEYNFYEFDISSDDKTWTPYLLLELVGFNYQNVKSHAASGEIIYGRKTSYAIPFGIGYKSKLYSTLAFAIETKFRYTFEDDLDFSIKNYPIKKFGSQGQQKTFLIALKLSKFDYLKDILGVKPFLLLDDIFDKLDEQRVAHLMKLVNENSFGQVFITDTQQERIEHIFENNNMDHRIFSIENQLIRNFISLG